MRLAFACRACRASGQADVDPGDAGEVSLEHEADCPFLIALESKRGDEWIAKHGNPVLVGIMEEGVPND